MILRFITALAWIFGAVCFLFAAQSVVMMYIVAKEDDFEKVKEQGIYVWRFGLPAVLCTAWLLAYYGVV